MSYRCLRNWIQLFSKRLRQLHWKRLWKAMSNLLTSVDRHIVVKEVSLQTFSGWRTLVYLYWLSKALWVLWHNYVITLFHPELVKYGWCQHFLPLPVQLLHSQLRYLTVPSITNIIFYLFNVCHPKEVFNTYIIIQWCVSCCVWLITSLYIYIPTLYWFLNCGIAIHLSLTLALNALPALLFGGVMLLKGESCCCWE